LSIGSVVALVGGCHQYATALRSPFSVLRGYDESRPEKIADRSVPCGLWIYKPRALPPELQVDTTCTYVRESSDGAILTIRHHPTDLKGPHIITPANSTPPGSNFLNRISSHPIFAAPLTLPENIPTLCLIHPCRPRHARPDHRSPSEPSSLRPNKRAHRMRLMAHLLLSCMFLRMNGEPKTRQLAQTGIVPCVWEALQAITLQQKPPRHCKTPASPR
jgi:hypothetical protein